MTTLRNFHVKVEAKDTGRPKTWKYSIVSVFEDDVLLGSYERNDLAYSQSTFYPFCLDGQWLALYSREYTATRVMSLPDCRDLGGEEPHSHGFCPVEYYVPCFRRFVGTHIGHGYAWHGREFDNQPIDLPPDQAALYRHEFGDWEFMRIGFIAGCVWGDDNSWKLQVLDLSRAADGIIKREERFGYLELPEGMRLKQALNFGEMTDMYGADTGRIHIIRQELRDLKTGPRD